MLIVTMGESELEAPLELRQPCLARRLVLRSAERVQRVRGYLGVAEFRIDGERPLAPGRALDPLSAQHVEQHLVAAGPRQFHARRQRLEDGQRLLRVPLGCLVLPLVPVQARQPPQRAALAQAIAHRARDPEGVETRRQRFVDLAGQIAFVRAHALAAAASACFATARGLSLRKAESNG